MQKNFGGSNKRYPEIVYFCIRVSIIRSAPVELPQGRKAARVKWLSDAI